MLLRRLELVNFKVFFGRNVIDFLADEDHNVILVHGDNGHGKSTVMESIFWALYGKEKRHDELVVGNPFRIINNTAKEEGDWNARVTLEFDHDGRDYLIKREVTSTRKRGRPQAKGDFAELVTMFINGRPEEDVVGVLNEIFPEDIATFFFFDGETISRYAESYADNRETIEKALGIPYLKRAIEDLTKVKKDLERELDTVTTSPELQRMKEELDLLHRSHDDTAKLVEIDGRMFDSLGVEVRRLETRLAEFDELHGIHQRVRELEEFSHELDTEEAAAGEKERSLRDGLHHYLLGPQLRAAVEQVGAAKERAVKDRINQGRLLDQRDFLSHLVHAGRCLCGAEFTDDSRDRVSVMLERVEGQLATLAPPPLDRPGWTNRDIATAVAAVSRAEQAVPNIAQLEGRRKYIRENRARVEKAMKYEHECLDTHAVKDQREREVFDRLTKITQDRGVYKAKREEHAEQVADFERKMRALESEVSRKVSRQNAETDRLAKMIGVADRSLASFAEIIERSVEQKRQRIERKGTSIYKEITNKPREFLGIVIDQETFDVRVRGRGDELVEPRRLSDGERHVLAISFLGGIKESAAEGTLIMDSPFGRLDATHKSRLVARLPDLARHVVLLVTDEDLREEEVQAMGSVDRRYTLDHDEERKASVVSLRAGGAIVTP